MPRVKLSRGGKIVLMVLQVYLLALVALILVRFLRIV